MTTATENQRIAQTIIAQLGGNMFAVMTGSKMFISIDNGVQFNIGRNSLKCNKITITLNGNDYYDVTYWSIRGVSIKIKREVTDIFAGTLRQEIEEATGLYTSL
jgi:hypothetical protein|tara:strand:+ start:654 stop:965 length:312 start_codon:yes stop_codon:yes gene_type:complete